MLEAKYLPQVRLLSDNELYQKAKAFVDECHEQFVEGKQQAGLLEFSRSWGELDAFIGHQKSRDWENISKKKAHYKVFYASLETSLQEVRDLVTQQKFVSGELPSNRKARQRYNAAIDDETYGTQPDDLLKISHAPQESKRGVRHQAIFSNDSLIDLQEQAIDSFVRRLENWQVPDKMSDFAQLGF